MEEWQRRHILDNFFELIELTRCNEHLLVFLQSKGVLSRYDVEEVLARSTNLQKTHFLYNILMKRMDGFDCLAEALKETKQTEALRILINDYEKLHDKTFKSTTHHEGKVGIRGIVHKKIYAIKLGCGNAYGIMTCIKVYYRSNVPPIITVGTIEKSIQEEHTWQKFTLRWNETILRESISSWPAFYESLRRMDVISEYYFNQAKRYSNCARVGHFFSVINFTEDDFYKTICEVLHKTKEENAAAILEQGYDLINKWRNSDARLKKTDFNSLAEAIAYSCDISKLKELYKTHKDKAFIFQTSSKSTKETLLHIATGCGHIPAILYLISIGMDVNAKDNLGSTPLHYLGSFGGDVVAVTQVLLENGSDLFHKNMFSDTVAHELCRYVGPQEYRAWVEYIVSIKGPKILQIENNLDRTPLCCAICSMELTGDALRVFLKMSGTDVNHSDNGGMTMLMMAAYNGQNRTVLELIVKEGGDWSKKDNAGEGVLHSSVKGGNVEALEYFLSIGADPNEKCNSGFAPLHYLSYSYLNHNLITKLLQKYEADFYAKTNEGDTVAHIFGSKIYMEKEYLAWKQFAISIECSELFTTINGEGEMPP